MRILLTIILIINLSLTAGHTQVVCDPGYIISANNCVACPAGTFQPNVDAVACQPCAIGFYSGPGAPECTACPVGYTTMTEGAGSINMCVPVDPIIPTMSQWALLIVGMLFTIIGVVFIRNRHNAAA